MSQVDRLQEQYPDLPREVITKWDVVCHGLRESADLDKVSEWTRDPGFYYHSDMTLKEMAEKRPDKVRPGFIKRPPISFMMKNGMGVGIRTDSGSDYEVRDQGDGKFALCQGDEKVEDIYFLRPKKRRAAEPTTSRGTPISVLVTGIRHCFSIAPVRFCEYFSTGEQCQFCNYNAKQRDARAVGLDDPITILLEETIEAYKIRASNVRIAEGRYVMGGVVDSEQEVTIFLPFIERLASATSYLPNITLTTQPMSRANMVRLKDAGVSCLTLNIEVWDRRLFEEICPGKAKNRGYQRYLEAYQEATEIFGWGHVGTNLPPGATLMPENGHRTWQDARDSQIEGIRWLVQHGVLPAWRSLLLHAGSVFGDNPANREKLPPTEYLLDLAVAHHEACTEYGMYDRMNKLLYCPMDCLFNLYAGEIGILERAGDVASWVADAVPAEVTWLADFVASVSSQHRDFEPVRELGSWSKGG